MRTYQFTILAVIFALLMSAPLSAAPSAVSCDFTATVAPKREGASSLSIEGTMLTSGSKLRIETVHPLTMEAMILIADFEKDTALMLYPDTLNGFRSNLSGMDKSGYLKIMRAFIEKGSVELPSGWKREQLADDKLNGKAAKHYKVTTKSGKKLDYWMNSESRLGKVASANDSGSVSILFTGYNAKATAKDGSFSHSKDYVISEIDDPSMLLGVTF